MDIAFLIHLPMILLAKMNTGNPFDKHINKIRFFFSKRVVIPVCYTHKPLREIAFSNDTISKKNPPDCLLNHPG